MANVKLKLDNLQKLLKQAKSLKNTKVKIGVSGTRGTKDNPTIVNIAEWLHNGWVQNTTPKQALKLKWLSNDKPIYGTLVLPPRPFVLAPFQAHKEEWVQKGQLAAKHAFKTTHDIKKASENFLKMVGVEGVKTIEQAIKVGGYGFEERSPLTMKILEQQGKVGSGTKPLFKTGQLANSIAFEIG